MKKRRSVNRLLTVLLAIVMVIELLPAGLKVQAMSAGCGSGTEEDPLVVKTFAELKEALESGRDLYIRVDEFENSEGKSYYELDPADCYKFTSDDTCAILLESGYSKHLELNTVIDIRAKDENIDYLIGNKDKLTVYGNGGIVFSVMSKNPTSCVLGNWATGQMSVWGNVSIEGKNDRADGSCAAIYAEAGYEATDIRGGRFKGTGLAAVALDQGLGSNKVTISGGHFENGTAGKPALYIFRDTDLKLSGGTFKGIEMESGGTAADLFAYLVEDYLYLINGDEPEDGTGLTKLEGDVVVYGDIPVVDVSIAFPRNGNKAADPVVTTKDVVLQNGSVKWERFDGDSRVAMGAEESFVAGEKYRVTFSVEDLEETHNIFPPITAPCPVWVNGHRITELDEGSDRYHYVIHYDFTASPVYIHSTNVNVEVPKAGAAPKDAVSTTEHTSVTKTEWAKWDNAEEDWVMMQPADTFEAGNDYRVLVTVAADEGCRISVNPGGSFNEDTEGTVLSVNAGEYRYYTSFNVPGAAGTVIEAINVNVAEPLAGALPADAVSTTEHVTVTKTLWKKYISEYNSVVMTAGETFEEGQVYGLEVTVETESGYEIGAHPVLSVNTSTEAQTVNRTYTLLEMYAKFTAAPSATISEVDVNLALPVGGVKQEKAVSATGHVSVTSTAWAYIDDGGKEVTLDPIIPFEAGKTYIVSVFARADSGYTFSENPVMRINGSINTTFIQKTAADKALFRAEFTATEKTLADLVITKLPDKTMYAPGESFDPTGMVVTAEYTDGSSSVVTGYSFTPATGLKPGDKEVIVSYTAGGVTKTAKVEIEVIMIADNLSVRFMNGNIFTYTGSKITPAVEVKYNGKILSEGVDYTVKYKNNIKASEGAAKQPTVIVTGKTFAATGSNTFTITKKNIADVDVIAEGLTVAAGKTAAPALYYGGKKLGKKDFSNLDAKVTFSADGNITVEGKGNFCGTRTIPVHVGEAKKISVTAFTPAERVYNMVAQPLTAAELSVMSGTTALILDQDYAVSYSANIAGTGTVKMAIVGIGEYSGSVNKSMKIAPCTSGVSVDVPAGVEFNPGGARPEVDVYTGAYKLSCGRDYTLKFSNNKAVTGAKKASVTVKFIGNFKGCAQVTKEFDITPYDLSAHGVSLYAEDMIYTKPGKYRKTPYVEVNGKLLSAKDMELSYSVDGKGMPDDMKIVDDMMQSGKLTIGVNATGKGNYTGTINGSFTLSKADKAQDLSKAKLSVEKKKYEFCAAPIVPNVTVKMGNDTLVMDQDYTVSCVMNVNKGKAICIIAGLGDAGTGPKKYYGSKVVKFSIVKGTLNWM